MLKTVKDYLSYTGSKTFEEHWVDYILSLDGYLQELEIKSIHEKDLTVENLRKELFELGKELNRK